MLPAADDAEREPIRLRFVKQRPSRFRFRATRVAVMTGELGLAYPGDQLGEMAVQGLDVAHVELQAFHDGRGYGEGVVPQLLSGGGEGDLEGALVLGVAASVDVTGGLEAFQQR